MASREGVKNTQQKTRKSCGCSDMSRGLGTGWFSTTTVFDGLRGLVGSFLFSIELTNLRNSSVALECLNVKCPKWPLCTTLYSSIIVSSVADHMIHAQQCSPGCSHNIRQSQVAKKPAETGRNERKQLVGGIIVAAKSEVTRNRVLWVDIFRDPLIQLHQQTSELSLTTFVARSLVPC